jgi:hydroxyacylglutathione hydrolase
MQSTCNSSVPSAASTNTESSFYLQQFNTACLSEFAYYIESDGEAVVIDPLRETKAYIELAASRNAKIIYVLETHFHADFVSGHVDLARATGAKIVYGPSAKADFELHVAQDNEELKVGKITLKVLHTPGHTLESSCYLLLDENRKERAVFTGDTLFLGAVGRPDLACNDGSGITKEDLAAMMYDSLRNKIMPIQDDVIVYPAHGAGSACGKGISKGTSSTMAEQKATNYALQPMTKEEFVTIVSSNIPKPPQYFFHDVSMNKKNTDDLSEVLKRSLNPLTVRQVQDLIAQGAIVVDCRDIKEFLQTGIVPGSVTISLALPFAVWAGTLLKPTDKIIVLSAVGKEEEAVIRLARVGYENCAGYIQGGIEQWVKDGQTLEQVLTTDTEGHLQQLKETVDSTILDVRNAPEWESGVYGGSVRIPLGQLEGRIAELNKNHKVHVLCKSGMRATIAYSLLRRGGFENLVIVQGGVDKLAEDGFKLEEFKA